MNSFNLHDITNTRNTDVHITPTGDGKRGWVSITVNQKLRWNEEVKVASDVTFYMDDVREFTEDLIAKLQEGLNNV